MTQPTYNDLYHLIDDSAMQERVRYALYVQAAYNLRLPSPDQHVLDWSRAVLVDNFNPPLRQIMIRLCATPPITTTGGAVLDGDVQSMVAGLQADLVALASGRA